jgi:hypothetical protein
VDTYLREGFGFPIGIGGKIPGQKIGDAVDGMICDAIEELAKIKLRIEAVQLRCANQRVKSCCPLTSAV